MFISFLLSHLFVYLFVWTNISKWTWNKFVFRTYLCSRYSLLRASPVQKLFIVCGDDYSMPVKVICATNFFFLISSFPFFDHTLDSLPILFCPVLDGGSGGIFSLEYTAKRISFYICELIRKYGCWLKIDQSFLKLRVQATESKHYNSCHKVFCAANVAQKMSEKCLAGVCAIATSIPQCIKSCNLLLGYRTIIVCPEQLVIDDIYDIHAVSYMLHAHCQHT